MLDADLAQLYEIETRVLVQVVKRNLERFPPDFMFQLSDQEFGNLRSQVVMSSTAASRSWADGVQHPTPSPSRGWPWCQRAAQCARIAVNVEIMRAASVTAQPRQRLMSHATADFRLPALGE